MHLAPLIIDLAIILAVASVMSFIFRLLKQPVVVGYLLAGIIIGPYTPPFQMVTDLPSIQTLAELGVIFLMFSLGLEFSFRKLAKVGMASMMTASVEVPLLLLLGWGLGRWLGLSPMESLFLGAMLSISSTTIIIKALEELGLKKRKFAQSIFGVLIVEDLFAILMLVALSTIVQEQSFSVINLTLSGIKLMFVVGCWFITGYFIIPRIIKYAQKVANPEMLTIISIALCLVLVVTAYQFGYSPALGAFIMGSILAETTLLHEIESGMQPLKDLFGAIFFVSIGMLIDPHVLLNNWDIILGLCLFVMVGKIILVTSGSLIAGQGLSHSMQVGMGQAQIGEFSFIIATLGLQTKAIKPEIYPIIVAVSLLTTFTTPFLISHSERWSKKVEGFLPIRYQALLLRYSRWIEFTGVEMKKEGYKGLILFKWIINGFIMTLIFLLARKFMVQVLDQRSLVFTGALLLSMPFIWAMVFGHRKVLKEYKRSESSVMPTLMFPLFTFIWLSSLGVLFFPWKIVLPVCLGLLLLLLGLTFRRLEKSYHWFERNFLENFKDEKKGHGMEALVPWDVHLVTIQVHPNSKYIVRSLIESQLRSRYGINVVAIKRGQDYLIAPDPTERLLPWDELLVLGTDEQIEAFKPEMETPATPMTGTESSDFQLNSFMVGDIPNLAGKTIRQSGFRDVYRSLVVGVEREGRRIVNPDTDETLQPNDKIWLVGTNLNLEELFRKGC